MERYVVHLVGIPVARFLAMQEHHDAFVRELSLITMDSPIRPVSERLLEIGAHVRAHFADQAETFRSGIQKAVERGDETVTLELRIAFEAMRWAEDFLVLFDEADASARRGELLTPPSPPAVVGFRRWLVGEIIRQVRDTAPPTPFADDPP